MKQNVAASRDVPTSVWEMAIERLHMCAQEVPLLNSISMCLNRNVSFHCFSFCYSVSMQVLFKRHDLSLDKGKTCEIGRFRLSSYEVAHAN